ncbi:MAG: succinate dehydrogenase assembly factor 2 [Alphaproteobacteria bacterium]|nr:succinate dehydrogenase assembly factor 2 [Alphaproteobacteria bacterium]
MSGTTLSSADLDPRRRRLLYRSWHRGMREMDLLMGQFADAHLLGFSDQELDLFETLSENQDQELLSWIDGSKPVPSEFDHEMFRRLKNFHDHTAPINL